MKVFDHYGAAPGVASRSWLRVDYLVCSQRHMSLIVPLSWAGDGPEPPCGAAGAYR